MLSKRNVVLVAVVMLCAIFSANSYAQSDLKIGYVNLAKIRDEAPQRAEAAKAFKEEFVAKKEQINKLQTELTSLGDKFNREALTMSSDERESFQKKYLAKKRKYQWEVNIFEEDQKLREQEMNARITQAILKAIQEVGQNGKYDMIVAEGILFRSARIDVTNDVLDILKKKAKK